MERWSKFTNVETFEVSYRTTFIYRPRSKTDGSSIDIATSFAKTFNTTP